MRLQWLTLVACAMAAPGLIAQSDAAAAMNASLGGKVVTIRGFYSGASLGYNSSGLNSGGSAGPWTLFGEFLFESAKMKHNTVHIQGERIVVGFVNHTLERKYFRAGHLDINYNFDQPPDDAAVESGAKQIFLTGKEALANFVPDYWGPLLKGEMKPQSSLADKKRQTDTPPNVTPTNAVDRKDEQPQQGEPNARGVYRVGKDVKPPKGLYTPGPEYSAYAKTAKLEGTTVLTLVVTPAGEASDIRVLSPLGYGLDDQAVEAVRKWRFGPGTKNGTPVPVQINVEVNFRLY